MLNKATLGQVEQLAVQLPIQEQLKLLSRLSERLTETISLPVIVDKEKREREAATGPRTCGRTVAYPMADKLDQRRRIKDLFTALSIQGAPMGARVLQQRMDQVGLIPDELSRSLVEAREE
ncbi:MAG: hypothetical protein J7M27_10545 [Candidatus Latescibacteria bacterium]|nr:hypothetical protein [Candidatus Latescibacterota bacterium]